MKTKCVRVLLGREGALRYAELGGWKTVEELKQNFTLTARDINTLWWPSYDDYYDPKRREVYEAGTTGVVASNCGERFYTAPLTLYQNKRGLKRYIAWRDFEDNLT